MTTSPQGIELIKTHEGFRSNPYLCPAGVPTIGFGATFYPDGRKVTMQDEPISMAEGAMLASITLSKFEDDVKKLVHNDLTQNQFDALVSFVYNVGAGAFARSTLRRKVNANPNDPSIAAEFARWNRGGGKVLPGLTKRRADEAKLYFS